MTVRLSPTFERQLAALGKPAVRAAAERARSHAETISNRIMPRSRGAEIAVIEELDGTYLTNTSYGSWIDEFGSINSPAYAPLRRGARASGADLRESK